MLLMREFEAGLRYTKTGSHNEGLIFIFGGDKI